MTVGWPIDFIGAAGATLTVLAPAGHQSYSRERNASAVAAGDGSIHRGSASLAHLWRRHRRLAADWLKWSNAGADVANSRNEAQARLRRRVTPFANVRCARIVWPCADGYICL